MKLKVTPWISLSLLLISYTGFGWYLSGIQTQPVWARSACYRVFGPIELPETTTHPSDSSPSTEEPVSEPSTHAVQEAPALTTPKAAPKQARKPKSKHPCRLIIEHNLLVALIAVLWVLVSTSIFISPLRNFSQFITHWFRSDTVAFATIFLVAGLAAVILFWLHVFLQILTILAADALARIDIQAAGLSGIQAFWILVLVSLTGLTLGWLANGVV